jgi:hypothetical protein
MDLRHALAGPEAERQQDERPESNAVERLLHKILPSGVDGGVHTRPVRVRISGHACSRSTVTLELPPAQHVRPYVRRNKTVRADAKRGRVAARGALRRYPAGAGEGTGAAGHCVGRRVKVHGALPDRLLCARVASRHQRR